MPDGWDFSVAGVRKGEVLVQTGHKGLSSMLMEVDVWRDRMRRGDFDEIRVADHRPQWIREHQGCLADQTRTIRPEHL